MAAFFTQEWVDTWRQAINASSAFCRAGAAWDDGIAFVLATNPTREAADDRAVYLQLSHGECREARVATPADLASASFVIATDAATWRKILAGKLDLMLAIMLGKFALRRGTLAALAPHAGAGRALLATIRDIPTDPLG